MIWIADVLDYRVGGVPLSLGVGAVEKHMVL